MQHRGQVVLKLNTPWRDGTTHLAMSLQESAPIHINSRFVAVKSSEGEGTRWERWVAAPDGMRSLGFGERVPPSQTGHPTDRLLARKACGSTDARRSPGGRSIQTIRWLPIDKEVPHRVGHGSLP